MLVKTMPDLSRFAAINNALAPPLVLLQILKKAQSDLT